MSKYCKKCGHKLENGAKFCRMCGAAIEQQRNPAQSEAKPSQKDEMKAWEEIYNATYAKAYSVAIQIVKNKEDALDILQESYIAAFKNMHTLRDKSKMGAWINQIVANRCKDWLRKKNPMLFSDIHNNEVDTELEFESNIPNQYQEFMPEATVDYNDTKKIMQGILDQLSPDQRLCILMYYYDEMSVGEIARALDCSSGTVKSRLNYARKYIKTQVEALERKGTKLYGIAAIPFIVWMLRSNENTLEVQAAKAPVKNRLQKSMAMAGKKALQGSAKDAAKVTAAKTASAGKKLLIAKIVAGITAATLAVSSGCIVYNNVSPENRKVSTTKTAKNQVPKKKTAAEKEKENLEALRKLRDKVDYEYLRKMCTYFEDGTKMNELDQKTLSEIYTNIFVYYGTSHYKDTDEAINEFREEAQQYWNEESFRTKERNLLGKNQIIKENENRIILKNSALDKFNILIGQKDGLKRTGNDHIKSNDGKYVMDYVEGMENDVKCEIKSKKIDVSNNQLLIGITRKQITDDGEMKKIPETAVLVPADNKYGYQLKEIRYDYPTDALDVDSIAEDITEKPEKVIALASILNNFDATKDSYDDFDSQDQLTQKMGEQERSGENSLIDKVKDDENMSQRYTFDADNFIEVCELIGTKMIDGIAYDGQSCQFIYDAEDEHPSKDTYFLRAQSDIKKDQVNVYYLMTEATEDDSEVTAYKKATVVLKPEQNIFGYKIERVKTEDWNDKYSKQMATMEKESREVGDIGDSGISTVIMQAIRDRGEYWKTQMNAQLTEVANQYPNKKQEIEKLKKEYEKEAEKMANKVAENVEPDGIGSSGISSESSYYFADLIGEYQKKVYFIVGNARMNNNIDALLKK